LKAGGCSFSPRFNLEPSRSHHVVVQCDGQFRECVGARFRVGKGGPQHSRQTASGHRAGKFVGKIKIYELKIYKNQFDIKCIAYQDIMNMPV